MSNYEQHEDSIQEENEQLQLVKDLHSLYDTHTADSQSLTRIRSRLVQRAAIPSADKDDDIITFQSLDTSEKRAGDIVISTTRRLNEWHNTRRHWPRLVSEIAAIILVTALVGSVLLVFSLRQHAPGHSGPQPSTANGQIQQIHMIDAKIGWAVVQTEHGSNIDPASAIMRTTDGGRTWYDVTPPESLNQWGTGVEVSQAPITDFLSANIAWIELEPVSPSNKASLYFTKNGGKTWRESMLPAVSARDGIVQVSFIDEQHGWLLTSSVAATPLDTENVTLFQTADSGKTWLKVSGSSASRSLSDTAPGPLPFTGAKIGFTFINAQTGWMVGETQKAHFFWLYVTHDGGRTWQHQDLPEPTLGSLPTSNIQILLQQPTFFDSRNGALPFAIPVQKGVPTNDIDAADGEIVGNYITHDAGLTWQSTPLTGEVNIGYSAYSQGVQFVDMRYAIYAYHNYVVFNFFDKSSQDASSSPISSAPLALGVITQLSFVSRNVGWVLIKDLTNENSPPHLYQTTDGGKSWTQVNYNVMGQQVQTSQKLNAGWVAVASYSDTGSKVMFLHGPVTPSKQWGLVLTCSGTGPFSMILLDSSLVSNAKTGIGSSGDASTVCYGPGSANWNGAPQSLQAAGGVQIQTDDNVSWNVLVVECSNSQGCSDAPVTH